MKPVRHLYDYFLPQHYALNLTIERETRQFHGTVTITGRKSHDDKPIRLHAKDLTIRWANVDDTAVPVALGENDEIQIGTDFTAGDYTLTIGFEGAITDSMHGIYPCYYQHDGVKKELIATQFESHHAREVFPCIDEPEAKATFELTLITEPGVTVLSNMPIARSELEKKEKQLQTVVFEKTPRMSTYLLAWVIGDLQSVSTTSSSGIDISVYATKAQPVENFNHALEVARQSIDFYEEYFGIPYPLPMSNHVALPDFSAAAMENWGLITYREVCLLTGPQASKATREYIATVISHELAHQWFGNLVTMQWWNDLWLNESFANVMEYIALDATHPQWHVWELFANAETPLALARDRFAAIQAVKYDIHHPDEINAAFDKAIVYAKGSRLIRMAREYVGDEAFRRGLTDYFRTHAYGNTVSDDLWRALSRASDRNVSAFMLPWLTIPGYPVVAVEETPDGYRLSQERFLSQRSHSDTLWTIPLSSRHPGIPTTLSTRTLDISCSHETLPLLNAESVNHFITYYDDPTFARVRAAFDAQQLTPIDRSSLLYEQLILAQSGYISSDRIIGLIKLCSDESTDIVWSMIALTVDELLYAQPDIWPMIYNICMPTYERLRETQNPHDSDNDKRVRAIVLSLLSRAGHQPVIEAMLSQFRTTHDLGTLPHAMHTSILGNAARHGDADDRRRLFDTHHTTPDPALRDEIAKALSVSRDDALLTQLFAALTNSTHFKPQDVSRMFGYLIKNPVARSQAWQWLEQNWDWIMTTYAGDLSFDRFIQYAGQGLAGDGWAERFEAFFAAQHLPALERVIAIGGDEIRMRTAWAAREASSPHATIE